jgi:hypothetical protein
VNDLYCKTNWRSICVLQPYKVYNWNADERQVPTLLSFQLLASANLERYLSSASFLAAAGKSCGLNFEIVPASFHQWVFDELHAGLFDLSIMH